jgi:hypothetical protein
MSVWRDLGAGAGRLIADVLLPIAPFGLYSGSGTLLAVATLVFALVNPASWRRVQ